jgi:hypothetical protein
LSRNRSSTNRPSCRIYKAKYMDDTPAERFERLQAPRSIKSEVDLGQEEGEIMMPFLVLSCFVLLFFCFFFLFTHLHALWFYILSSLALRCSYETFYSFVVSVHPPFYCFLVYSTTIGASFFFF